MIKRRTLHLNTEVYIIQRDAFERLASLILLAQELRADRELAEYYGFRACLPNYERDVLISQIPLEITDAARISAKQSIELMFSEK